MKTTPSTLTKLLKFATISASILGAQTVTAQDHFFIEHKPTDFRFSSCSDVDGTAVIANDTLDKSSCSQWERVPVGDFFFLKNRASGKFIRPDSADNGASIVIRPSSWTGSWTQWSYIQKGDFGHLKNRATGKFVFIAGDDGGGELSQQPSTWQGDYTQWAFVSAGSSPDVTMTPTATPTATATPTVTVTPTFEPGSTVFEAESGVLAGIAREYDDSAASGGKGVAFLSEEGASVSFTNVRGSDSMIVRYASINTGKLSVAVNSADIADISFTATGDWAGRYDTATLPINIPQNATVQIFFDTGDAAMNIDTVEFKQSGPEVTPTPTITATPCTDDCPTMTPTPTPSPTGCGMPDVDPQADLGEGYVVGITKGGLVYHRAIEGHNPNFAQLNNLTTGENSNIPANGPNLFQEKSLSSEAYRRYEMQMAAVDPDTTYTIELRLQGEQFGTGQCTPQFQIKPGEGLTSSECFVGGGVVEPPAPPSATATKIIDAENGLARLVGGPGSEKPGFALYVFANDETNVSNCSGRCEEVWPKLIVANEEDAIQAGGVTGSFGVIPRTRTIVDECNVQTEVTDYHVTYNGAPLYFYRDDTSADTTAGANLANWDLATADLIPQLPVVAHPAPALKTTINGLIPKDFGYAIDIEGRTLTWRPSANANNSAGLIQQFSPWAGDGQPVSAKDPQLELYCSNNQIQFHKASMPGVLAGPYKTEIPAACYGKFYYFLRYRIYGTVNNDPEGNWVYTALYEYDDTKPNDRIDPRDRPTITYTSANWQRVGHPHSRDRVEEAILFDAHPYGSTLISSLERYTTTFIDGEGTFRVQPNASIAPMRIEAFEWGAGNCQGPQYMINAKNPMGDNRFDYGQIVSWEATFGGSNNSFPGGTSEGSQIYNTMQNVTVGQGFTSATGDPRLNLAGFFGVRMVHSDGCNPVEKEERNAKFAQQLTSVQSAAQVNDFILGHNQFHGLPQHRGARVGDTGFAGSKAIVDIEGNTRKAPDMGSCGDCHFRDGRSDFVVQTDKGPRLAPPTYGTGLLEHIENASVGLTWDGSVPTIREQTEKALLADLGLRPSDIGQQNFDRVVTYTQTLHVPVRLYSSYADPDVAEGEVAFHEVGCASCHQPTQKTSSSEDTPDWARGIYLRPYTDMKRWDVGTGGSFRTPPLWGIGQNITLLQRNGKKTLFMHDGRATSLEAAIDAHGNGSVSNMTSTQKANIIKFMETL